jgi:putative ABC transport system permease protein
VDALIALESALGAFRTNKLRAFLTSLGVVIGVGAVLTMVAVSEGTNRKLKEEMSSLGSNLLLVLPGAQTASGRRMGSGGIQTLTYEDTLAVADLDSVDSAAPSVRKVVQAIYKNLNWATSLRGTSPLYARVRDYEVESGRFFTLQEMQAQAKVCLLGKTVIENLFLGEDPMGKTIRINRLPFRVIGVLKEKGSTPHGSDQDDIIFVPLLTAQRKILGITHITAMMVKAKDGRLKQAEEDITALLRQRHRLTAREESDFTIRNLTEFMERAESASRSMGFMLGAVASVSLLVGGIGIMNIMLVSVTERTREIGLRRAVGATKTDVRIQFLVEALLLCGFGGLLGVAVGAGTAHLLSVFGGFEFAMPLWAVMLAFLFSLAVGVVFGFYPALKASSVDPIVALRYE